MLLVKQFLEFLSPSQNCSSLFKNSQSSTYLFSLCYPDYNQSVISFQQELEYDYHDLLDVYSKLLEMLKSKIAILPSSLSSLPCSPQMLMSDSYMFHQACKFILIPGTADVKCFYAFFLPQLNLSSNIVPRHVLSQDLFLRSFNSYHCFKCFSAFFVELKSVQTYFIFISKWKFPLCTGEESGDLPVRSCPSHLQEASPPFWEP